jgi:crossover junction endonuclease EME1
MAPEVISLLSSPSEPSPARPVGPSKTSRPVPGRPHAPSRALDFGRDAYLDIENIVAGASKASALVLPRVNTGSKHGNHNDSPGPHRLKDDGFHFLSDDFDTTGDLSFSKPISPPRISGASTKHETHRGRSTAGPASAATGAKPRLLQPAGIGKTKAAFDPIEHSSSPMEKIHEDDPFASSPQRPSKGKQPVRLGLSNAGHAAPNRQSAEIIMISDLDSEPDGSPPLKKGKAPRRAAAWDPISSSMPELNTTHDDDPFASSPPPGPKRKAGIIDLDDSDVSGTDADDDLPAIGAIDFAKVKETSRSLKRSKTMPVKSAANRPAPKIAEEKELDKKQKAAARDAEKERRRVAKEREKQEKALQKEKDKALAEVNKIRTDKKVSTIEMIVDLPVSLAPGISVQVRTLLEDLKVQHSTWSSPVDNVVKWRRKVDKRFNDELDYWEPIPLRLEPENHVLVIVAAAEFVKLATGSEGVDLEAHVLKMKTKFPGNALVYLIEGLDIWFRKNRTALNRQFQNAARNDPTEAQGRGRNAAHQIVDEEVVEDALMSLHVDHEVLIHKTSAPVETAQWITVFTQHISTIPYRKARDDVSASAGFCVESGQVKTGDGAKDTYIHMLQEIARVTAPMAYSIAAKYPTVMDLARGFERDGPLALEDLRKSANRDGRLTDQRIGQAISRRLYKIFMEKDPTSTDV